MSGLQRYRELMAAAKVVGAAETEVFTSERSSPAFWKLNRVSRYLSAQAGHVMEGRNEEGDWSGVGAAKKLLKAIGVPEVVNELGEPIELPEWLLSQMGSMMLRPGGYSADEAEDMEEAIKVCAANVGEVVGVGGAR